MKAFNAPSLFKYHISKSNEFITKISVLSLYRRIQTCSSCLRLYVILQFLVLMSSCRLLHHALCGIMHFLFQIMQLPSALFITISKRSQSPNTRNSKNIPSTASTLYDASFSDCL